MNALSHTAFEGGNPQTMTTREVADLTGKRHDNVMRDTRAMLIELYGETDLLKFEGIEKDSRNRDQMVYRLPKRESLILVSGYDLTMRAKIIDRWAELEERQRDPMMMLNDPAVIRGMLLVYSERLMIAEPKADALDRIAASDGSMCVTDAAKTLQVRPKVLFSYLRENKWIYTRAGSAGEVAYQDKLQQGLLEHKVTTVSRTDGSEKSVTQVRVTPKGLAKLAQAFPPQPPMAIAA